MPLDRDQLLDFLKSEAIEARTVEHPPLATVADSQALRGALDGGHTKNLFLKDKKGRHFLVSVEEDAVVDLKTIHSLIGGSGRVSFGNPEAMQDYLGVKPGAVTLFAAANDTENKVTVVIDAALLAHETINAHPLVNTATTAVSRADMLRFLDLVGHKPLVLKVAS